MSGGIIHSTGSVGAGLGILTGAIVVSAMGEQYIPAALVGCFFQLFLQPDLDLDAKNISSNYARKFKLGWLYDVFFAPYRAGFKHRSFWSHAPIFGTILRIIYLFCPPFVIILFSDQDKNNTALTAKNVSLSFVSFLLSVPVWLVLFAWFHYNLDWNHLLSFSFSIMMNDVLHWLYDQLN